MARSTAFTLCTADGIEVSVTVNESTLHQMYKNGNGGLLALQFCSAVGGAKNGLRIKLPMAMDKVTLDSVKDCLEDFFSQSAGAVDEIDSPSFQVHISYEMASGPFLAALDYLQVPVGDGPIFDTVAAKWKYQVTVRVEEIGRQIVTQFLEPALLGGANMSAFSETLVLFQIKPKSVRPREGYVVGIELEPGEWAMVMGQRNALVFASVQEKRPRSKGVKFYRIYDTLCGSQQMLCCDNMLLEKEVDWDDTFDTLVAELFENSFKKTLFLEVLKASGRLAGLGIEILDDANAVLFTAPWLG